MRNKAIMSMIGTAVVTVGLLASNNAEATVRIRAFGFDICFTGKKNPHGCDVAKATNPGVQVVVLEDEAMANMEKMKGQTIKVEAVAPVKVRDGVGYSDAKAAKFKAGKALADTVKRNGNASNAGDDGSGPLNREKYKKLNGYTFPPPPRLPEDDTCVSISNCP